MISASKLHQKCSKLFGFATCILAKKAKNNKFKSRKMIYGPSEYFHELFFKKSESAYKNLLKIFKILWFIRL